MLRGNTLSLPHSSPHCFPFTHQPRVFKPAAGTTFTTSAAAATVGVDSVGTKPSAKTPYQVLRINHTASQAEIKAAYRSLAKLYHPDAASSDPNGWDFIEIHNAYATLSDPAARANYDLSIHTVAGHCNLGYSTSNTFPGFRPTRRWETDQCW